MSSRDRALDIAAELGWLSSTKWLTWQTFGEAASLRQVSRRGAQVFQTIVCESTVKTATELERRRQLREQA